MVGASSHVHTYVRHTNIPSAAATTAACCTAPATREDARPKKNCTDEDAKSSA
jgi:hypothetical protein